MKKTKIMLAMVLTTLTSVSALAQAVVRETVRDQKRFNVVVVERTIQASLERCLNSYQVEQDTIRNYDSESIAYDAAGVCEVALEQTRTSDRLVEVLTAVNKAPLGLGKKGNEGFISVTPTARGYRIKIEEMPRDRYDRKSIDKALANHRVMTQVFEISALIQTVEAAGN